MAVSLPPPGNSEDGRYTPLAEINVTPMVDVMLVLLVIFMVAAPLLTVSVPINLPKSSAAATTQPQEPIIVSIDAGGDTYIGDDKIEAADLSGRLASLAAVDPARIVYVRGDRTKSPPRTPPLGLAQVGKQVPPALRCVRLVAVTPLRAGPSCSLPGQALKPTEEGSTLHADPGSKLDAD
jgi:biopolymer transport protein ExbD